MEKARLYNNEIMEVKATDELIVRPEEAQEGFGWYNVEYVEPVIAKSKKVTGYEHQFNDNKVTKVEILEDIPLDQYKLDAKDLVKINHLKILSEGFLSTTGIRMDCGEFDVVRVMLYYQEIQELGHTEGKFRDFDNKSHILSLEVYGALVLELKAYTQQKTFEYWATQESIDDATTYEQIDLIVGGL